MNRVTAWLKKEIVLTASWVLALISMLWVHPSPAYIGYIDFRSLGILWSLMVIMIVLREKRVFDVIGQKLMQRTKQWGQLAAVLVFLCFFSSMLITNDVALITFVPFAVLVLKQCGREDALIPVIVLQTIAANLGSMMTPVGNPQNLYLFGLTGMSFASFVQLVGPYTLISAILLAVCILTMKDGKGAVSSAAQKSQGVQDAGIVAVYGVLFVLALLSVLRVLPWEAAAAAVLLATLIFSRSSILRADYSLLMTFVGFFIFTGNIKAIPAVSDALASVVGGHEVTVGVLLSQVISNVPAALLLSGFAQSLDKLILGVNFGGLGTMIASMASLISFKQLAAEQPNAKGRYMVRFTVMNLAFLAVLMLAERLIG